MKKDFTELDAFCADVEKDIKKRALLCDGDKVLTALSGGADSVALLYALKKIAGSLDIEVFACHVNHGIRGDEADRDEQFCKALCDKIGVSFKSVRIDVPAECKKSGEGMEECARRLRYIELDAAADRFGCNRIATAHHADDNIETVLLHMIRGCGLHGITGIPFVRGRIVRPLLSFPKDRIIKALHSEKVPYVYDSTNSDTDMSRNMLRHNVLPQIYKLNPSAYEAFRRLCDSAAADEAFIEKEVSRVCLTANRKELSELDYAVLSRYIRKRYDAFGGTQIENSQVSDICREIKKNNGSAKFLLPDKVTAYVDRHGVAFVRETSKKEYELALNLGENIISSCGYRLFITKDKNVAIEWKNIYRLSTLMSVSSDRILNEGKLSLTARSRIAGDRYVFGKLGRDVRKQLINFHVSEYRRKNLPCITSDSSIVAVPYLPVADGFRAASEKDALFIVFADENIYG